MISETLTPSGTSSEGRLTRHSTPVSCSRSRLGHGRPCPILIQIVRGRCQLYHHFCLSPSFNHKRPKTRNLVESVPLDVDKHVPRAPGRHTLHIDVQFRARACTNPQYGYRYTCRPATLCTEITLICSGQESIVTSFVLMAFAFGSCCGKWSPAKNSVKRTQVASRCKGVTVHNRRQGSLTGFTRPAGSSSSRLQNPEKSYTNCPKHHFQGFVEQKAWFGIRPVSPLHLYGAVVPTAQGVHGHLLDIVSPTPPGHTDASSGTSGRSIKAMRRPHDKGYLAILAQDVSSNSGDHAVFPTK